MKIRRSSMRRRYLRNGGVLAALVSSSLMIGGCGSQSPHSGRIPFRLLEDAPRSEGKPMAMVAEHHLQDGAPSQRLLNSIRPGDVIAFHMSHAEAWGYLRKGVIQKVPYELFRYGHIALVVPNPEETSLPAEPRLLQIAMKQAANATEGLGYLKDKSWHVYRPPAGSVDVAKLHEFAQRVTVTAGDPKQAYDYQGILGIRNAPCEPGAYAEIGEKYSCATLVVAGLHYSGYPLDALHRGGRFDLVTPRQVVESGAR